LLNLKSSKIEYSIEKGPEHVRSFYPEKIDPKFDAFTPPLSLLFIKVVTRFLPRKKLLNACAVQGTKLLSFFVLSLNILTSPD
jgi:hypothetical protein